MRLDAVAAVFHGVGAVAERVNTDGTKIVPLLELLTQFLHPFGRNAAPLFRGETKRADGKPCFTHGGPPFE